MQTVPLARGRSLDLRPAKQGFLEVGLIVLAFFKRFPLAGLVLSMLVSAGFIYQFASHTVAVFEDEELLLEGRSFSRTVDELLKEVGLELHPRDRVTPARSAILSSFTRIDIDRAFPVVVIADNTISVIWTPVAAVEQLLAEEGFTLGPFDRIEPDGLEEVYPMAEVKIVRVTKAYTSQRSVVPFAEVSRGNMLLDQGLSRVISEGRKGLQEDLFEITYEDGKEVDRDVVQTTILENPVNRTVEYGENTRLERDGRVMIFDRVMIMTATSYCPGTPGSGCPIINELGHSYCTHSENDGYTYTGKRAVQGEGTLSSPRMVAVDPRVIPLGSMLYIEEIPGIGKIGFARAEDIGGAIKGKKIDILYNMHSDVARFGIRFGVKVYVLTGY